MESDQKAEQAPVLGWAKTIGYAFGEELVRRWNAYEKMHTELQALRISEQCRVSAEEECERLRWALAIMWHAYEGGHRPPAKVIAMAEECYRMGKGRKDAHASDE